MNLVDFWSFSVMTLFSILARMVWNTYWRWPDVMIRYRAKCRLPVVWSDNRFCVGQCRFLLIRGDQFRVFIILRCDHDDMGRSKADGSLWLTRKLEPEPAYQNLWASSRHMHICSKNVFNIFLLKNDFFSLSFGDCKVYCQVLSATDFLFAQTSVYLPMRTALSRISAKLEWSQSQCGQRSISKNAIAWRSWPHRFRCVKWTNRLLDKNEN